jgi:hypothetical protein
MIVLLFLKYPDFMKKIIAQLLFLAALPLLSGCFGQHNKAPNEGVNLDSKRIYGESREAPPRQLPNQYPDPSAETMDRIQKIRDKMFPE